MRHLVFSISLIYPALSLNKIWSNKVILSLLCYRSPYTLLLPVPQPLVERKEEGLFEELDNYVEKKKALLQEVPSALQGLSHVWVFSQHWS